MPSSQEPSQPSTAQEVEAVSPDVATPDVATPDLATLSLVPVGSEAEERVYDRDAGHSSTLLELDRFAIHPAWIHSMSPGAETIKLGYPYNQPLKEIVKFKSADCEDFCFKDCIVYGKLASGPKRGFMKAVHKEWFLRRARPEDTGCGGFFSKFLCLPTGENRLEVGDLVTFHVALCKQLELKTPMITMVPSGHGGKRPMKWELTKTLPIVFLFLEPGYGGDKEDLLAVCKGPETGLALGLETDDQVIKETMLNVRDANGTIWMTYRTNLQRAMRAVVSLDPHRREARDQDSPFWNDEYGAKSRMHRARGPFGTIAGMDYMLPLSWDEFANALKPR